MNKIEFAPGTRVYAPEHGSDVYTVTVNENSKDIKFPICVNGLEYRLDGTRSHLDDEKMLPRLFVANEQNYNLLSQLMPSVAFQHHSFDPVIFANNECVKKLLSFHQLVPCRCADTGRDILICEYSEHKNMFVDTYGNHFTNVARIECESGDYYE